MTDKPLKVHITGDINNPASIEIVEVETGAKLTNVLAVDIHIERGECRLELVLYGSGSGLDLSGYANVTIQT